MTEPEQIAAGLTKAQRLYITEGPHLHWTPTRRALARMLLVKADGSLGAHGLAVRAILERQADHG